jgi:predicted Zn-dependent protease
MLKPSRWIVIALPFLILGCGSGGVGSVLGGGAASISLDQEWQLGQQIAAQVAQQTKFVNDPQALAYLRQIGERIHAQTPLRDRPFTFYIVDDNDVNAFSIPGGHVYVNRGLIAQADKEDMLAGVVAHEITHVVLRHALKQMEQANEINAIGSILLGNAGQLAQIAGQVVAGGAMARFSRADEKQADDGGLQYMTAAGYDPHGMLDMFQKLLSLEQSHPGAVARFFADHPGTQDRINDISGRISQMGNPSGTVDTQAYHLNLKDRM